MLVYITKIKTCFDDSEILEIFDLYQEALDSKPSSFYNQTTKNSWKNKNGHVFYISSHTVVKKTKVNTIKCALCKHTYYEVDMFDYNSDLCYDCGLDSYEFQEKSLDWFKRFETAMEEALG